MKIQSKVEEAKQTIEKVRYEIEDWISSGIKNNYRKELLRQIKVLLDECVLKLEDVLKKSLPRIRRVKKWSNF